MSLMHRLVSIILLSATTAAVAAAQTASATLSADLGAIAKLSVSTTSLSFPDSNPDVAPQVQASSGPVTITAKGRARPGETVTLTVQASADLRSGVNTIPASAITWTATGPGFVPGTLSATAAQTVGAWTGSGVRVGTQDYRFQNLWTYPTGIYSASLLYTLTSP
jgi:hypothetical protein